MRQEGRKRKRPIIYDPRVITFLCAFGLVCAVITWNGLAVLGWIAAICGALSALEGDRGRDAERDS